MRAYLRAVRQYNRGKTDRNQEILGRHTGLDRALLREACWPSFRADGQIDVRSVRDFQIWALSRGLLDQRLTEQQFWDPQFVQDAVAKQNPAEE